MKSYKGEYVRQWYCSGCRKAFFLPTTETAFCCPYCGEDREIEERVTCYQLKGE